MQKKMDRYKFLDVLIVLGSILFSLVTITVFCFPGQRFDDALDTILLFQIIMGNAVMAFSFGRRNRFYQFYTGVILFLWGVFTFIFNKWLPLTIYQWWPVYVELSAFALLGSGFYKYRKMKLGFVFPAAALIGLGIWYSLFSFKIIPMSFAEASMIFGPILLISIAVLMFILLKMQNKNKKFIIEDEDDVFEEDEIPFKEFDDEE